MNPNDPYIEKVLKEFRNKADELLFRHEIKCASWVHKTCDCKNGYPLDLLTELTKSILLTQRNEIIKSVEYNLQKRTWEIVEETIYDFEHPQKDKNLEMLSELKGELNKALTAASRAVDGEEK